MELLYVAALVVSLTVAFAFLFGRLLKGQSARRRIGGWGRVIAPQPDAVRQWAVAWGSHMRGR
jgi:hypothetical protein